MHVSAAQTEQPLSFFGTQVLRYSIVTVVHVYV